MSATMPNLTYYLRLACRKAGVQWNSDNDAELDVITDEVRAIVRAEMADEIHDLRNEVRDLRNRVTFVEQAASGIRP